MDMTFNIDKGNVPSENNSIVNDDKEDVRPSEKPAINDDKLDTTIGLILKNARSGKGSTFNEDNDIVRFGKDSTVDDDKENERSDKYSVFDDDNENARSGKYTTVNADKENEQPGKNTSVDNEDENIRSADNKDLTVNDQILDTELSKFTIDENRAIPSPMPTGVQRYKKEELDLNPELANKIKKRTPDIDDWCVQEEHRVGKANLYDPCARSKCKFKHEDQWVWMHSSERETQEGKLPDPANPWGKLQKPNGRTRSRATRKKGGGETQTDTIDSQRKRQAKDVGRRLTKRLCKEAKGGVHGRTTGHGG
jgi:hypothetical protein